MSLDDLVTSAANGGEDWPPVASWEQMINAAVLIPRSRAQAETFVIRYGTNAAPVGLRCADGQTYVVKSLQQNRPDEDIGRIMFNDQVAARLGALLGAPVPVVGLVEVSQALIDLNSDPSSAMGHLKAGTAHGSLWMDGMVDSRGFDHQGEGDNRSRYAKLAVLFGWLFSGDRQFIAQKQQPYAVYSHDHGHFFPGGPAWTVASISGYTQAATADQETVNAVGLTMADLVPACTPLASVTRDQIADILGIPPASWVVPIADRVAMAEYLWRRREELLNMYVNVAPAAA